MFNNRDWKENAAQAKLYIKEKYSLQMADKLHDLMKGKANLSDEEKRVFLPVMNNYYGADFSPLEDSKAESILSTMLKSATPEAKNALTEVIKKHYYAKNFLIKLHTAIHSDESQDKTSLCAITNTLIAMQSIDMLAIISCTRIK